ncbi:hypothetical protein GCM10010492_67090 [Saccharothrix mutabilis subsp. mutabilis]|uniref:Uncharacterized protein n=1 Tax=Saccharothrix mutabilis subsp. mutabilis TaxID=66855 RepID=A0ABP3E9P9_9PSEU
MTAFYADEANEWPVYAVERARSWTPSGPRTLYRLYDETSMYFLGAEGDGSLSYVEHRDHNAGVVPVIRFVDEDDLDSDIPGVVEPVIDIQDRLNYSTFLLLMAGSTALTGSVGPPGWSWTRARNRPSGRTGCCTPTAPKPASGRSTSPR